MDKQVDKLLEDAITAAARDPLLKVRQTTHGDFNQGSFVAQQLKYTFRKHSAVKLNSAQMEALDLIATKIGRILSGNPNFLDHWDDIAGYAKLGAEACER